MSIYFFIFIGIYSHIYEANNFGFDTLSSPYLITQDVLLVNLFSVFKV